jgi:hypothetical protein
MTAQRSPFDVAADVFVYAPLGLALRFAKDVPQLAKAGRSKFETPLMAARIVGKVAVDQHFGQQHGRFTDQLRKVAEPYFGGTANVATEAPSPAPAAATPRTKPTKPTRPSTARPSTRSKKGPTSPDSLAIPGYQTLPASQVVQHLTSLKPAELRAIDAYERATRNRKTITSRIEQLLSVR